jgi:hypothetical protein
MAAWEDVVELGKTLPEVEESTSWGTPALKVRRKMIARLREDGKTLVVGCVPSTRSDWWPRSAPAWKLAEADRATRV